MADDSSRLPSWSRSDPDTGSIETWGCIASRFMMGRPEGSIGSCKRSPHGMVAAIMRPASGCPWRSFWAQTRCSRSRRPRRLPGWRRAWMNSMLLSRVICERNRSSWSNVKPTILEVPANADFVIEGYVDPKEPLRTEGPFGDHTGYYSLADSLSRCCFVTAITRRRDAVYPCDHCRRAADGGFLSLGAASVKLFLPIFKVNFP